MIKDKLKVAVEAAVSASIASGKLGASTANTQEVVIEEPRLSEHGDLACGIAMKLASRARMAPLKIAETLSQHMKVTGEQVASLEVVSPGYLNFRLGTAWLADTLHAIHQAGPEFGKTALGKGKRVLVEYVSANPTGDLHIGHARGAVYGSCLANLLKFVGFVVEQEFYINDTGEQFAQFSRCAWKAYQRRLGKNVDYPQEGYPEDSITDFIDQVIMSKNDSLLALEDEQAEHQVGVLTMDVILVGQEQLLETLGIKFDRWFSEKALHDKGKVNEVLAGFARNNMSYEADGALWLKAKELGDERDRVLRKSDGNTTYLAADAAYHLDKYERGYDYLITIWGADHHGQVPGLKAAMKALGRDAEKLEVILTQIVNLSRDGQIVRMSKRKGTVVTLAEVMEEVGGDAVRYYLAECNPQNPINFDLELAKQTSKENPAFYIQYAHARCSSILRKALDESPNAETREIEAALISKRQWQDYLISYKSTPDAFYKAFDCDPQIFVHQKALIMRLSSFPEVVVASAIMRTPGRIARYAYELANDLQKFYEVSRVITSDPEVTKARLGVIAATKQVLVNALGIIGVSAPDRM